MTRGKGAARGEERSSRARELSRIVTQQRIAVA